jgi:sulfate transport system substrate-binding protein
VEHQGRLERLTLIAAAVGAVLALAGRAQAQESLLNVSYDPTRELYHDVDQVFPAIWKTQSGHTVTIKTSNGGSGAQARAVIEGLPADVVTLALASDIDALAKKKLVSADWATKFPNNAVPYTSVAVLLVRKGNPKGIKDWGDLAKPGVSVVTPNPKTSGGARWNFLAALGWAMRQPGATKASELDYMHKLYANVAVLDTGARGSTTTFVQRGIGDVLIAAENEAKLALQEFGGAGFEVIYPSVSILEEAPVAVVDSVVDKKGDRLLAEAYLNFLWTPQGQAIAAKHFFRPRDPAVAAKYAAAFPHETTFDISTFGGWKVAQKDNFGDGGVYDQISAGLSK